jgi:hypothetical protein
MWFAVLMSVGWGCVNAQPERNEIEGDSRMNRTTSQTAIHPYAVSATRGFDRAVHGAASRSAIREIGSGARSTFNTLGFVAGLNLLGGIAVAVAASYTGAFQSLLTFIFGVEVAIALLCFAATLRWARE